MNSLGKKGAIISVDKAGWSVLTDEFLQVLGQGIGRLRYNFGHEGVFAEEITDEQVFFAFVGELAVISCHKLLRISLGSINCAGEEAWCRWCISRPNLLYLC